MSIKTVDLQGSRQNVHFKLVADDKPYLSYIVTHFYIYLYHAICSALPDADLGHGRFIVVLTAFRHF